MKKIIIPLVLILALLISGCSASTNDAMANTGNNTSKPAAGESWDSSADTGYDSDYNYKAEDAPADVPETEGGMSGSNAPDKVSDFKEKIIYTANARVETVEFDKTVEGLTEMVENYGGFVQDSYMTGNSYRAEFYSQPVYRYAQYTLRIPTEGYGSFTKALDSLGVVTSLSQGSQNITTQFYDAKARLETYAIEEERILSMLSKAETVSEMIELESRLSEIRYQIESLESKLRNWQNQVDYSTVSVEISEVQKLTPMVDTQRTYWQEMGDGLKSTFRDIGDFFKDLFMGLVVSGPVLIIFAVIIVVVFIIIRKAVKKRRAERFPTPRPQKDDENDENV